MSISDTIQMEDLVEQVTDHFDAEMRKLFQEVPERFGGQTEAMWNAQCSNASMDLMTQIHAVIELFELKLVARGEYFEESVLNSRANELYEEYECGLDE